MDKNSICLTCAKPITKLYEKAIEAFCNKECCDRYDELYTEVQLGDFTIGQSYVKTSCETVVCSKCRGSEFIVGASSCYTAIKCKRCKWQKCIHEG